MARKKKTVDHPPVHFEVIGNVRMTRDGELVDRLDASGAEVLDPRPIEIPVALRRSETISEQVRRLVSHEISAMAHNQGFETFEESNDFYIEGEDLESEYELDDDHESAYQTDRDAFYKERNARKKEAVGKGNFGDREEVLGNRETPTRTEEGSGKSESSVVGNSSSGKS